MKWLLLIPSLAFAQVGRAPFYVAPTVAVAGNAVAYITGTAVDGTAVVEVSSSSFIPNEVRIVAIVLRTIASKLSFDRSC